jgi:hypothetical protein
VNLVPEVDLDSSLSSNFEIIALNAEFGGKLLPLVRGFVEDALSYAHREIDFEGVTGHVRRGSMQLWVAYNKQDRTAVGAAVTMLYSYDLCHSLRILALAGKEFQHWKVPMLIRLESFARAQDATRIEASGRKGWARVLKPLGFEPAYVTFIKEL